MMKNLEDLHGNLECIAMARKWNMEQIKPWKEKGEESLQRSSEQGSSGLGEGQGIRGG
jgi:hypothetical protein